MPVTKDISKPDRRADRGKKAQNSASLHMNPKPTKDGTGRRVICLHYGACLDVAVRAKWKGFTCEHCTGFEAPRMDPEEWMQDALRCAGLLYAAFFPAAYDHCQSGEWINAVKAVREPGVEA